MLFRVSAAMRFLSTFFPLYFFIAGHHKRDLENAQFDSDGLTLMSATEFSRFPCMFYLNLKHH